MHRRKRCDLRLLQLGLRVLGVSVRTVQKHVEHILTKLGVETRTAAAAWAHQVAGSGRGAGPFQEQWL